MLKLSSCCDISQQNFFGDKTVIRSSIHATRTFNGSIADANMRPGLGWDAVACTRLENQNYQPKQNGQNRFELVI